MLCKLLKKHCQKVRVCVRSPDGNRRVLSLPHFSISRQSKLICPEAQSLPQHLNSTEVDAHSLNADTFLLSVSPPYPVAMLLLTTVGFLMYRL